MNLPALFLIHKLGLFQKHWTAIKFFVYIVGFILFLALSAYVYLMLEGDTQKNSQTAIMNAKEKILKKYPNIPAEALDDFMDELKTEGIQGLPAKNTTNSTMRFSDAFFFTVTLVTTVGYGHITPVTSNGKTFCIVYAAIGIPVAVVLLTLFVNEIEKLTNSFRNLLFNKYQGKIGLFYIRLVHAAIIVLLIWLVCFILAPFCFTRIEKNWTMFDGIYFCVISLSTVGLGDMVPAMDPNMPHYDLYLYAASLYLFFGIGLVMVQLSVLTKLCENYKEENYSQLPYTTPTEQFPINPHPIHTYGSLVTKNGKTVVKYDQLVT